MSNEEKTDISFPRYLSPLAVLAFSLGTSIGWGSLVVTNQSYLGQAGPAGSVLGMLIGAAVMLIMARNYSYMMSAFPEAGGAYAYSREIFGYDHGFLTSWFLALSYLAILWANATSLPLFARYFLGSMFRFGKLYTIFGYDVFLGEALLSVVAVCLVAFLCSRQVKMMSAFMIVIVILFTAGILVCFAGGVAGSPPSFDPAFLPDAGILTQVVTIACISPWAFIGFENISHTVEEFSFKNTKIFRILVVSVIVTTILYICIMLLSVTAYPPEYSTWLEYIRDLPNLEGIRGLPAFYAADRYMGHTGIVILMVSLLSLILSSLIGNITALSRLFYALGKDSILPASFGTLNRHGAPGKSILLIAVVSSVIPFFGRTAIGWIVDVTTLGATLVYGFVSACALKLAYSCGDKVEKKTGLAGLIFSIGIGLYTLLPNLFMTGSMATESFFLFVVWSVLGFICFRIIVRKDQFVHFGKSIIVWVALLSLVLFVSLVWMNQSIMDATNAGMRNIEEYYTDAGMADTQAGMISLQMDAVRQASARSIIVVVILFAVCLGILLNNYRLMSIRAAFSERQLGIVRDMANSDPLTGVKSKHAFAEKEKEMNENILQGRKEPFAVAVCDVNGLKHINDTYGHKAGDEYIKEACHMICEFFAHSPVYRTGGDEFVVLLTGHDYDRRGEIMEAFHQQAVENIAARKVVVSAGLSDYLPEEDENLHTVFERADALMYKEKKALKNMGAVTRL